MRVLNQKIHTGLFTVLYILWSLLVLVCTSNVTLNSLVIYKFIFLLAIYFAARCLSSPKTVFTILMFLGLVQAMVAIAQLSGIIKSNHSIFQITGLMGNPGQLGGFQAVSLVSSITLLVQMDFKPGRRSLVAVACLVILFSLIIADSRAGWVAAALGIAVLFSRQIVDFARRRKWMVAVLLAITAIFAIGLYYYRPSSADARLLIWRISASMAGDIPWVGFGYGGFVRHYMLYQARYFEHASSPLATVADNVSYPYNEFLQIAVEQGLVGLALFIAVIVTTIRATEDRRLTAPLVAFLFFSCFSYPLSKLELAFLLPLLFGCLHGMSDSHKRIRIPIGLVSFMLVIFASGIMIVQKSHYNETLAGVYRENGYCENLTRIHSYARNNIHDIETNSRYASALNELPELVTSESIASLLPNCENLCTIAEFHIRKKDYRSAETALQTAALMVPTRLKPHYLLWRLYRKTGNEESAEEVGKHVLSMHLKTENTYTLRVKQEIRESMKKTITTHSHETLY